MNGICPPTCSVGLPGGPLGFPVGQVRRLAPGPGESGDVDETKRNVLKLLGVAGLIAAGGAGLGAGSLQFVQPPMVGVSSYPKVQLLDVDGGPLTVTKMMAEYNVDTAELLTFNYPLRNEPNLLLNVGSAPGKTNGAANVVGGIGPQKSIVAFSGICQHLGCPIPALAYYPPGACSGQPGGKSFYIHCTCHGSTYDVTNAAANLTGPAVVPLPQVVLEWNSADDSISATSVVGPAVNGHPDTLLGDYPVGNSVQVQKQPAPEYICKFPGL